MEEKERYEIHMYDDCNVDLYNNGVLDKSITNQWELEKLLNQQDKHIKELELLLKADKKIKTNSLNGFEKLRHENQQLKKTQKQLAIEELEFVLKNFRNRPAYFDVARQELCLSDQDKQFIDFINNRIKKLCGGENE